MNRLIPFDEYKKLIEIGKQQSERKGSNIGCPCCKKELLLKDETVDCLVCPCCNWEGKIPV